MCVAPDDMAAFFVNEPDLVNELVAMLCLEDSIPEEIQTLALKVLATQSLDRARQATVLQAISAGGHRGTLATLMERAISSLADESQAGLRCLIDLPFNCDNNCALWYIHRSAKRKMLRGSTVISYPKSRKRSDQH